MVSFNLDSILNFVVPIGVFLFLFYIVVVNVPIFRRFLEATINFIKEQMSGVKEKAYEKSTTTLSEISYG